VKRGSAEAQLTTGEEDLKGKYNGTHFVEFTLSR